MNTYLVSFGGPNAATIYVNSKTYAGARRNAARRLKRSMRGILVVTMSTRA